MKNALVALFVGVLFGVGLVLSGMTQPQKVIGFLDILGNWDPSLAFVMVGAIGVHFLAYRVVKKVNTPFLASAFQIPNKKDIDRPLVIGSVLFGLGWGLGGYCPGPAITSIVSLQKESMIFVVALILGMFSYDMWNKLKSKG